MKNLLFSILNILGANITSSPDEFAMKLHLLDHQEFIEGSLQYVFSHGSVLFGGPVKFGKNVLHLHSYSHLQVYEEDRRQIAPSFESKLTVVRLVHEISSFDREKAFSSRKEEIVAFIPKKEHNSAKTSCS